MDPARAFVHASSLGHPAAAPFYKLHPKEPIAPAGDLTIVVTALLKRMTALDLLQQMVRQSASLQGGDVLIVGHGTDEGMSMPLAPVRTSAARLQNNALELLFENERGAITDEEAARRLGLPRDVLTRLKDLTGRVQGLGIRRVEVRACTVGAKQTTLQNLRQFFGARQFGGPRVLDAFGGFNPVRSGSTKKFEKFLTDHPGAAVEGPSGHRLAFTRHPSGLIKDSAVESAKALEIWAAQKFPSGKLPPAKGEVLYHALLERQQLTFPNEKRYRDLLAAV
jgi:hypothetical protein